LEYRADFAFGKNEVCFVREAGELALTVGRARERASPTDKAWRNRVSEGGELPVDAMLRIVAPRLSYIRPLRGRSNW